MSKVKVHAKYYAFSKSKPKSGKDDGEFDSPDITEAEKFEVFFPPGGFETKKEFIDKIRESADLDAVETSIYGKKGNVVRYYKYQNKKRVVLNSKEQFEDLMANVSGGSNDAKIHVKLIPQNVQWQIGPGGKLNVQGENNINKGSLSQREMLDSLKVDQKVKDIKTIMSKENKN